MTTINTAPEKQSWWLNLTRMLHKLWNFDINSTYIPGSNNRFIRVSGETVKIDPTVNIYNLYGTIHVFSKAIEDFAQKHPDEGYNLKHCIKVRGLNARVGKGQPLELAVIKPFINANFTHGNRLHRKPKKENDNGKENLGARMFADAAVDYRPIRMQDNPEDA